MTAEMLNNEKLRVYLKGKEKISLPELQTDFGLSYVQAKEARSLCVECGWISPTPEGIYYSVLSEFLEVRELSKAALKSLAVDMPEDCLKTIVYLAKQGPATFEDLLDVVVGEDDTNLAISILKDNNLIRVINGKYYPIIAAHSAEILIEFIKHRRNG